MFRTQYPLRTVFGQRLCEFGCYSRELVGRGPRPHHDALGAVIDAQHRHSCFIGLAGGATPMLATAECLRDRPEGFLSLTELRLEELCSVEAGANICNVVLTVTIVAPTAAVRLVADGPVWCEIRG